MKRWNWGLLAVLVLAVPGTPHSRAAPLPLGELHRAFGAMARPPVARGRDRTDSLTGARIVHTVVPGGPAEKAGVKPGTAPQAGRRGPEAVVRGQGRLEAWLERTATRRRSPWAARATARCASSTCMR